MPFWSRKGKEKAKNQDSADIDPFVDVDDDVTVPIERFRTVKTIDGQPNPTREKLKKYWEDEAERRRMRIEKVEEAEGKCSIAHMAAYEAAIEALNMCLEVSARSKPEGVSFISDSEDAALLQKFEETGEAFVPAIVTRSSIDTLVSIHETCCCSHIKRDRAYRAELLKDRSFRGSNPIRNIPTATAEQTSRFDKASYEMDAAKTRDKYADTATAPGGASEEEENLPSYKEATS